jgi:hypothetical protein
MLQLQDLELNDLDILVILLGRELVLPVLMVFHEGVEFTLIVEN